MSGRGRGAAVLHVVTDGIIVGVVELEDQVRPESREAVEALHKQGIKVAMITGDAEQVAKAGGRGIERCALPRLGAAQLTTGAQLSADGGLTQFLT